MRHSILPMIFLYVLTAGCGRTQNENREFSAKTFSMATIPGCIAEIPLPEGFERIKTDSSSFTYWLRSIPLRKDKTVYLFSGQKKQNQAAQYAVADLPVGTKDLQQCADVVMRLRAEYVFSTGQFSAIRFTDYAGKEYILGNSSTVAAFHQFMEKVYGFCGSASLEKQLHPVSSVTDLQPGDVFIKGGFPGHAMIVADVATNRKGKKIFLLMQGFLPAQDIHVVNNPTDKSLGPWYEMNESAQIITPEWMFKNENLRRW